MPHTAVNYTFIAFVLKYFAPWFPGGLNEFEWVLTLYEDFLGSSKEVPNNCIVKIAIFYFWGQSSDQWDMYLIALKAAILKVFFKP